jgi:hypothetical protein
VKILFQIRSKHYPFRGVLQTLKDIVKNEGPMALYKGNMATVVRIFPYAAVQFVVYEEIKKVMGKEKKKTNQSKTERKKERKLEFFFFFKFFCSGQTKKEFLYAWRKTENLGQFAGGERCWSHVGVGHISSGSRSRPSRCCRKNQTLQWCMGCTQDHSNERGNCCVVQRDISHFVGIPTRFFFSLHVL